MKLSDIAYWNTSNFNNISLIFGIGYSFCFNCLFRFLSSLRKRTRFDLGLVWAKDRDPHSESFSTLRTPSRTRRSTYFLKISSCTFGTRYGREKIGFAYSFNSKSTGSVFQEVFHWTTIQNFVKIAAIHYVVSMLNVDTGFL